MYIFEGLCALAVAFFCANVEASVSQTVSWSGEVKRFDQKVFKVDCGGSPCIFEGITYSQAGDYYIVGKEGGSTFCELPYPLNSCPNQNLNGNEFLLYAIPNPNFNGATITVKLGNSRMSITELEAEGASIQVDPKTNKKYIRLQSGFRNQIKPHRVSQYRIGCSGNCKDLQLSLKSIEGGEAILVASKNEPVFPRGYGCYNCFCSSLKLQNSKFVNTATCEDNGIQKFDVDTSYVYITLIPYQSFKNVKATLTGDNIADIRKYNTDPAWDHYQYAGIWNADETIVKPIEGPLPDGTYVHLKVWCTDDDTCDNITLEVDSDVGVKILRAGKNTRTNPSGVCPDCDCNGDCENGFKPSLTCNPYAADGSFMHARCYFYATLQMNNHPASKDNGEDFIWYVIMNGESSRLAKIEDAYYPYDKKDHYP